MNARTILIHERILGGLWGALVGDALGVPVEFQNRSAREKDPVSDMREFGTHHQPKGTWSDDSSLILSTVESLLRFEFDTEDIGKQFVRWHRENVWTPHGEIFDIGVATSHALKRIAMGMRAELAGGGDQYSNGNGSLMRILPVSLRFATQPTPQMLDKVHRASAITHRHPRSQIACGLYSLVIRELLAGKSALEAFSNGVQTFRDFYEADPYWAAELDFFQLLLEKDFSTRPESEIDSSGYVIHTLCASLWCLLNTNSYQDCVLKAVNLGGDTDTTGCVAGGLAGALYGLKAIPAEWRAELSRSKDIEQLFESFASKLARKEGE